MKSLKIFVFIFTLVVCQDVEHIKYDDMKLILMTVKSLEIKLQDMDDRISTELQERDTLLATKLDERDTLLATKLDELRNQMTVIEGKLEEENPMEGSSKGDQMLQVLADILEGEREQQTELLLRNTCSRDQVTELQELLITDECYMDTHSCSANAACVDLLTGYKCTCLPGYNGDGFTCEDIDECWTGVSSCHPEAECTNTDGSYNCTCQIGFTGNGYSCEAIPCTSASVSIPGLRCVSLIKDLMTWEAAKQHCKTLGGRLLEVITSRHQIDQLKEHFSSSVGAFFPWVGVMKWGWNSTGDPIPDSSPLWRGSQPDRTSNEECAAIHLSGTNTGLYDRPCSDTRPPLCQK